MSAGKDPGGSPWRRLPMAHTVFLPSGQTAGAGGAQLPPILATLLISQVDRDPSSEIILLNDFPERILNNREPRLLLEIFRIPSECPLLKENSSVS